MSDIALVRDTDDGSIRMMINGWAIAKVDYCGICLIKTEEDAIEIAKEFVKVIEDKYGDVKNEDFENDAKLAPHLECVEGYESPQFTVEEFEEFKVKRMGDFLDMIGE